MKKINYLFTLLVFGSIILSAQNRNLEVDSVVITKHQTTANGISFPYTATTGKPVWDNDGEVIASLFYTYYKRTDIKNDSKRPLLISFNGGPGSASVWMHVAYTGPKILNVDRRIPITTLWS